LVLLFVLAVIAIATVRMVALARTMVSARQELQIQEWQLQAGWLAQAGLQRAAARLRERSDYAGETWKVSAEEMGGSDGAVVRIEVDKLAGEPGRRRVRVVADYPDSPQHRARESREAIVAAGRVGRAQRAPPETGRVGQARRASAGPPSETR
jgi:Tfp pilus assembly protein PilV